MRITVSLTVSMSIRLSSSTEMDCCLIGTLGGNCPDSVKRLFLSTNPMEYTLNPGEIVIGIDLGTSNTSCCVFDGQRYEMVSFDGSTVLPSYVSYMKNGSVLCGRAAKNRFGRANSFTVCNSKRIIGRSYSDNEVQLLENNCGVNIVNEAGVPKFIVSREGKTVSPTEVATEIIKTVLDQVRKTHPGKTIAKAVITTPAYFNANQKTATIQAGVNAGLPRNCIDTVNEPTAAAVCYSVDNAVTDQNILVYDLGGGTFDLSILHVHDNTYSVVACDGDNAFGGVDIDKCVMEILQSKYEAMIDRPLLTPDLPEEVQMRYYRQLQSIAEECKIALSSTTDTSADLSMLDHLKSDEGGSEDMVVLTRQEMNEAIRPLIDRTLIMTRHLLSDANMRAANIDSVVMVGGSSHLSIVDSVLKREFGESKVTVGIDPSECVAKGGCMYVVNKVSSQELSSFSMGTSLVNNLVMWIIPYHSPLPITCSVTVKTAEDYVTTVRTKVMEGHAEESNVIESITADMVSLPPYSFSGFAAKPAGEVSFSVQYTMKQNGILYITAKDLTTGRLLLENHEISYVEWSGLLDQTRTLLALARRLDSLRLHLIDDR